MAARKRTATRSKKPAPARRSPTPRGVIADKTGAGPVATKDAISSGKRGDEPLGNRSTGGGAADTAAEGGAAAIPSVGVTVMTVALTPDRQRYLLDRLRVLGASPGSGAPELDITRVLSDPLAFQLAVNPFVERLTGVDVDYLAASGPESAVWAAPIARALNLPLLLLRKRVVRTGRASAATEPVIMEATGPEPSGGRRLVLMDLLLANGERSVAGVNAARACGAHVVLHLFLAELTSMGARDTLDAPVFALVQV